jgi:hypothetical protein
VAVHTSIYKLFIIDNELVQEEKIMEIKNNNIHSTSAQIIKINILLLLLNIQNNMKKVNKLKKFTQKPIVLL